MANREESQAISQEILAFKEESRIHIGKSGRAVARRKPTALWSHFLSHEWSSAVLYLFLDVISWLDRKSTRLNSSHSQISYAVFCLEKNELPTSGRHCVAV